MTGGAGNDEMKGAQAKKPKEILTAAEKEREESGKEGQSKWRSSDVDGIWTAVTDKEYLGIATVVIKNSDEMRFDYYRTTSGELYDSVTLFRDHSKFVSTN
jgi:hypothetical protein